MNKTLETAVFPLGLQIQTLGWGGSGQANGLAKKHFYSTPFQGGGYNLL